MPTMTAVQHQAEIDQEDLRQSHADELGDHLKHDVLGEFRYRLLMLENNTSIEGKRATRVRRVIDSGLEEMAYILTGHPEPTEL